MTLDHHRQPALETVPLTQVAEGFEKPSQTLEAGEYEWAHPGHAFQPDRVKKVRKIDPTITIAQGLEDLCDFNAPEQKEKERTMEKAEQVEF